jgi:hypothetical protein
VGEPADDLTGVRWIGATVPAAVEKHRGAIVGRDRPVEVGTEGAIPAATRMIRSLHPPAHTPFTSALGEEQMLALGSPADEGDAPSLRVAEGHSIERLETHDAEFSMRRT